LENDPDVLEVLNDQLRRFKISYLTGPPPISQRFDEIRNMIRGRQELLGNIDRALEEAGESGPYPAHAASAPLEPVRYTDVSFYDGHLYPSDDLLTEKRLPDDVPLAAGLSYTMEVAIRQKRTGVDADRDSPRSVTNPRQDKETLTLFVLARSQWPGIEIPESFATVTWPYTEDSRSAMFRLQTKDVGLGQPSSGVIEVRIYDRSLDLLDIVVVSVMVIATDPKGKAVPGVPSRRLSWPDMQPGVPLIEPHAPSRLFSIHVTPVDNRYRFDLLFRSRTHDVIEVPMLCDISADDLTNLLTRVRDFWTTLAITSYSSQVTVTRTSFERYLSELKDIGTYAWSVLFGSRYADLAGASESIGQLLTAIDGSDGSLIQVTYAQGITDFVFPWSILYPPSKLASPNPSLFWGARHQIEQVTSGPKRDALDDEPINVLFALDPGFGNSASQTQLFDTYQAAAPDKLLVSATISDQKTLFTSLARDPSAHLVYFFCHGYASAGRGVIRPDGVKRLKEQIEAIPTDSPERQALEQLLTLTARMSDESWMYLGNSEIKESRLRSEPFFNRKRPIVLLNMCQSADLLPSLSRGFVRLFLDHNASAVIGTECPMSSAFASAFGGTLLKCLFGGDDVGTALWKARRYFLSDEMRNPLGLAYTLYGRATAKLGTRPILTDSSKCSHVK
jgi:hypothetical protein